MDQLQPNPVDPQVRTREDHLAVVASEAAPGWADREAQRPAELPALGELAVHQVEPEDVAAKLPTVEGLQTQEYPRTEADEAAERATAEAWGETPAKADRDDKAA